MTVDEIEAIGAALAAARKHGTLADLALDRISSDEEAEAVQAAGVEAYGGAPLGYSIQATSALARRLFGCEAPIFGVLADTDVVYDGAKFPLPHGVLGAGCAFAFVFGRPYPGEDEEISRETVRNAISSCRLTIEVLGRRVPGSSVLNRRTATADFALNVLFVEGSTIGRWAELDSQQLRCPRESMDRSQLKAAEPMSCSILSMRSPGLRGLSRPGTVKSKRANW